VDGLRAKICCAACPSNDEQRHTFARASTSRCTVMASKPYTAALLVSRPLFPGGTYGATASPELDKTTPHCLHTTCLDGTSDCGLLEGRLWQWGALPSRHYSASPYHLESDGWRSTRTVGSGGDGRPPQARRRLGAVRHCAGGLQSISPPQDPLESVPTSASLEAIAASPPQMARLDG